MRLSRRALVLGGIAVAGVSAASTETAAAEVVDRLYVESCPLHTEWSAVAAEAPAQVEAALRRNAHVIGFTELRPAQAALRQEVADLCAAYGYGFHAGQDDSTIAYRHSLNDVTTGEIDGGSPRQFIEYVQFWFHGRRCRVHALHWPTDTRAHALVRARLTRSLISAMNAASAGGVGFFVADDNPSLPQRNPDSRPRKTLADAGMPLVWAELDYWPSGVGVTTIGRNLDDRVVSALDAYLSDPLGSDHHPGTAAYGIVRPA